MIAECDAQASGDHVEGEHAPHEWADAILKKEDRGGDQTDGGDHEEERGVHPIDTMERNPKVHKYVLVRKSDGNLDDLRRWRSDYAKSAE